MCKVRILRTLVAQRLNVAVEEIFELFEKTIAEYEEELCRSKEENERQRLLLDVVLKPHVRLHKADMQQVLEESPDEVADVEQEWPAEPAHIKEEEKDVWRSRDVEQLQRLEEEADVNQFTLIDVHVKSEEDNDKSTRLHGSQSEENREAAGNAHSPNNNFPPLSDAPEMLSPLSDTDHSDDAQKPSHSQSAQKCFICPQCGRTFTYKKTLKTHMIIHTGEKDFACSFCAKQFYRKCDMKNHMATHTNEKPFGCGICGKGFTLRKYMMIHVKTHGGPLYARPRVTTEGKRGKEKTFRCHMCEKRFTHQKNVIRHVRTHTGEKAFGCDACAQRFSYKYQLDKHPCFVMDAVSTHSEATDKRFVEFRTM